MISGDLCFFMQSPYPCPLPLPIFLLMPNLRKLFLMAGVLTLSAASFAYYGQSQGLLAAEGLLETGATVRAESLLLETLRKNPYDIEVWAKLGDFYQANDRLNEALAAYERAVHLSADEPEHRLKRLTVLLRLGRVDDAESGAHEILSGHPESADAYRLLGWISLKKAQDGALRVDGLDPDRGLLAEADRRFRELLRIEPDDAEALVGRAMIARMEGREVDAVDLLERAVLTDTALYWGWQTLGESLRALGRDVDALAAFNRAQALAAGRPYSLMEMAGIARSQDRHQEAAELTAQIGAEGAYNRGVDLWTAGQLPAAENAFLEALVYDPEDDLALDRLEQVRVLMYPADDTRRLELAARRLAQGTEAEAVNNALLAYKNYKTAIRLAPQLSDARLQMARFLNRVGTFASAVKELQRVEELTRSQNERLVASDLMEVITRKALSEMESVHRVEFGEIWDLPTSTLGDLIGNPETLEARVRWGVNPVVKPHLRIAILPFVEAAPPVHMRIGSLVTEWLNFTLGLLPGFEIIPPETIQNAAVRRMATRAEQVDPGQLGDDLKADVIVEGRILEAREDITIEVKAVRIPGGRVLWTQSYSLKGPEALNRVLLEIARSFSQQVPLQGSVIRRQGGKTVTVNLGRVHGMQGGDTVVVVRNAKDIFVPGLDWPGHREEIVATARVAGMTERYCEIIPVEGGEKIRAGDMVKRRPLPSSSVTVPGL